MKDKMVKEFRWFLLPEYEEEEKYLREQHKKGLAFEKVSAPGFYCFRECEPEDVLYKLDFNPQKEKDEAYLQMYADYGWEYIQQMNGYNYFRKSAAEAEADGYDEIFNDNESKVDMMQKIYTTKMLPLLVVFLLIILPQVGNVMNNGFTGPVGIAVGLVSAVLIILYVYIIARCTAGFQKLRKKYDNKN